MAVADEHLKNLILCTITDMTGDFMYYDRKDDEDLPRGKIEEAVKKGLVTIDEMVERFRKVLTQVCN